jgi:hypothetical protein
MSDDSSSSGELTPIFDDEQAEEHVRHVWHDGRWFFSVIDVVGFLTGSAAPRKYWTAMKARIQDEGFREVSTCCQQLRLRAPDGKQRVTDCADFATIMALLFAIPAWQRKQREYPGGDGNEDDRDAGIYAITNTITHEQYIGSSSDISSRFKAHLSELRRGKHHAGKLQAAWDAYGEDNFRLDVLEHIPFMETLPLIEQQYIDEYQPSYNGAAIALNKSALPPVSQDRIRALIAQFKEAGELGEQSEFLSAVIEAIIVGALRPGPNFHLLLEAPRTPAAQKAS